MLPELGPNRIGAILILSYFKKTCVTRLMKFARLNFCAIAEITHQLLRGLLTIYTAPVVTLSIRGGLKLATGVNKGAP